MHNPTDVVVRVPALGLVVEPGGYCEVSDGYALRKRAANGRISPPVIVGMAPRLVPAPEELERFTLMTTHDLGKAQVKAKPGAADLIAKGMAPGVAEIIASAEITQGKVEVKGDDPDRVVAEAVKTFQALEVEKGEPPAEDAPPPPAEPTSEPPAEEPAPIEVAVEDVQVLEPVEMSDDAPAEPVVKRGRARKGK